MRILYIHTLFDPHVAGGAEITLQTLVHGIAARRHQAIVLATGPDAGITEDVVGGVRVLRAGLANIYWHYQCRRPPGWMRAGWHLRDIYNPAMGKVVEEIVRRERPDIVSCHNLAGWSSAAWLAIKRVGVPLVHVLHDLYLLCPNSNMFRGGHACATQCLRCRLFRSPHPRLSNAVDAVVGVSRFILERHLHHGYFGEVPIRRVIHNSRAINVSSRPYLEVGNRPLRFGYMGALTLPKGVDRLLRVFEDIDASKAELWIAGSGRPDYERYLTERYRSQHIRFLGHSKPESFFSAIDTLVVPSISHDTLPGVIIEALAYGVPVIGSKRGGIPEIIEDGANGFLYDPDSREELPRLLMELAANPDRIESMRRAARRSARPYLEVDRWVDSYLALYQAAIAQAGVEGQR